MHIWQISVAAAFTLCLTGPVHARSCDGTQGTTPKAHPDVIQGVPSCPEDDGNIFLTPDGSFYTMQCCMHQSEGTKLIATVHTSGYDDCINRCSETDNCNGFQYIYGDSGNERTGDCRLYSSAMFSTQKCGNTLHDWAFLTDPPVIEAKQEVQLACSTKCPDADGQLYKAKNKQVFHMDCQKRHGTAWFHKTEKDTLKACINSCASYIGCQSVDFHQRTRQCYLGKHQGEPAVQASGWASAHSMGCSGACDENEACSLNEPAEPLLENVIPPASESGQTPSQFSAPANLDITCDSNNNQVVKIDGKNYHILCGKQFRDPVTGYKPVKSFTECLELCGNTDNCSSVDFYDPHGGKTCYMFTSNQEPPYEHSNIWAAVQV
ncbi:hypothetical protein CIHG_08318 [Coccidioides immitis H538.4]|uniref:Apple domain-containing protein n=1 Tax=Coccidioides immitis H538.4 TaxID=396776 RepID=A0A0J8S0H2_COCIT|nr:hypothetical protein CIHG_08318 [Coccidioides immitis H538.4]